ncbi:hypothetical protein GDO78_015867 [Eleutherodactylus coqui]|uniref:ethanolamine kinase n=1 Tax=Eleutherodactylus coqui TaxID=57060 RepID=A0A8J6EQE6_ELECQ|nr:hypothetical protein GDO78_015867 [Eleutherodactylus coqui]
MANYIHLPPGSPEVPRLELTVLESDYREGALRLLKELRPEWRPEEVTTQGWGPSNLILCLLFWGVRYIVFPVLPPFRLIARRLAKIHAIHAHNGWIPKSNLWLKMRAYFSLTPTEFPDRLVHDRFVRDVPNRAVLEQEMAWMEVALSSLGSPVVLCHNDLLCKNIIYNEKSDGVQFIDYEYSGYNYQAYDIGNHFNEFAGVNEVDYSLYPDRVLQLHWLRDYLEAYKQFKGVRAEVSENEVERLYVQVNQFALASHFFWGLWALIQAKYSKIDFDFLGYAIVRLNQYLKMKPEVMGLSLPE